MAYSLKPLHHNLQLPNCMVFLRSTNAMQKAEAGFIGQPPVGGN